MKKALKKAKVVGRFYASSLLRSLVLPTCPAHLSRKLLQLKLRHLAIRLLLRYYVSQAGKCFCHTIQLKSNEGATMESDDEQEQVLAKFREAQRLIDRSAARRKRRPAIPEQLLVWIVIILVVGGIAAWFGIPAFLQFQVINPAKTFCNQVSAHDYQDAYALFSRSFQDTVSYTQFSNDITTSNLTYCATNSYAQLTDYYQHAQVDMTFEFADSTGSAITQDDGSFSFVFENFGWRITSVTSPELTMS